MLAFFASDLHGHEGRYDRLFDAIERHRPHAVLLGGDLLSHGFTRAILRAAAGGVPAGSGCLADVVGARLAGLRSRLRDASPRVFAILGNDDPRLEESGARELERRGLWDYIHDRSIDWGDRTVYGYACVPPTPFHLKDWERYDVSRYVDPGCVSPEEGWHSTTVDPRVLRQSTIADDLRRLAAEHDQSNAIWLFHSPPFDTPLDRAGLDGRMVDHAPMALHVGSIAIRRFIESRQPAVTLHGHIHESARLTGAWRIQLGRTHCFSAAHDGDELALVVFDTGDPAAAERWLL
jgi:Icc-related predicted phosphoesterase